MTRSSIDRTVFVLLLFWTVATAQDSSENSRGNDQPDRRHLPSEYLCRSGQTCVPEHRCTNSSVTEGTADYLTSSNRCELTRGFKCCNEQNVIRCPSSATSSENSSFCGVRGDIGIIRRQFETEAEYGEFPWTMMVLKRQLVSEATIEQYKCGGSLIHPRVVLTAARCVENHSTDELLVRGGEYDMQYDVEFVETQDRIVTEVVVHPAYYKRQLHNDVALLFLNDSLELNEMIQTVCLPTEDTNVDHQRCFVSGWRKPRDDDEDTYQTRMGKLELPVVPSTQCDKMLKTTRLGTKFKLHDGIMCAGEVAKDNCKVGVGSPLVCAINGTNFYQQAGILSWGLECNGTIPAAYVDVSRYRKWIDQEMGNHQIDTCSYVL